MARPIRVSDSRGERTVGMRRRGRRRSRTSQDPPEGDRPAIREIPPPRTSGLVLVVDDNAGFRGLAARILSGWGYEVIEAGTVAEAVVCAVERRPRTR